MNAHKAVSVELSTSSTAPDYSSNSDRPVRDTVVMAFVFLLIYTPFQALQNLQSTLHQQHGLGMASLATLYACTALISFVVPVILHYTGVKACLMLSWVMHMLFVASNVSSGWATLLPASALLGCCSCPEWTACNTYIAALARVRVEEERLKNSEKKGVSRVEPAIYACFSQLNGLFKAIFTTCQVAGNLLSSVILFLSSHDRKAGSATVPPPPLPPSTSSPLRTSYSVNVSSSQCGATYCPLAGQGESVVLPEKYIFNILLGIFIALDVLAMGITYFFLPNLEQPKRKGLHLQRKLRSYWTVFSKPKMLLLSPLFLTRGMSVSVQVGLFTEAFVGCAMGIRMVGFVMAVWGLCAVLSAVLLGHAARFTGRKVQYGAAFAVDGGILIAMLWWRPDEGSLATLFSAACAMGFVGGIWTVQGSALVATFFPDALDSAFSLSLMWASLSQAIFFLMAKFLCPPDRMYISLSLLAVAVVCYSLAEGLQRRDVQKAQSFECMEKTRLIDRQSDRECD